jgi:hypothetical protein
MRARLDVSAATLLLRARDQGPAPLPDLLRAVGIRVPVQSIDYEARGAVLDKLARLAEAGLVTATCGDQPLSPDDLRAAAGSWLEDDAVVVAVTPLLKTIQTALGVSLSKLHEEAEERPAAPATVTAVRDCIERARSASINPQYRQDLLVTLGEIATCFEVNCFVATVALGGKVLEITLRQVLLDAAITPNEPAMIGQLLRLVREKLPKVYLDPGLKNVANIINESRIPAIHQLAEAVPVPSAHQASMVVFAMLDVVERHLLGRRPRDVADGDAV